MTTALLDADIIAFKAAAVSSTSIDWGDGEEERSFSRHQCEEAVNHLVQQWTKAAGARRFFACMTSPDNYRKAVWSGYKANRKGMKPPAGLGHAKNYIATNYPLLLIPRLEADDVMGIYATSGEFSDAVIVSTDKDLRSVPARLINPDNPNRSQLISKSVANRFWLTQTLTGDASDGFAGAKGIGPKKAEALLRDCQSLAEAWDIVVRTFISCGQSEEEAILNAQMARILRAEDWDAKNQKFRLWHPSAPRWLATVSTPSSDRPTTTSATSKSSTSSPRSQPTTPVTKRTPSETSSSTSPAPRTRGARSRTSKRPSST